MDRYHPADPLETPRFAGTPTFLRLPHETRLDGVDVAVVGLPFDTGVSFRAGARFGPKAIREGSLALRTGYNPAQRVSVFERLSVVDYGDTAVAPGSSERSYELMQEKLAKLHAADVVPLVLGGDHSVLLAELRAAAQRHGPLAVVDFDAHLDTADAFLGEKYSHGTVMRRALEEGLVDAACSTLMGMRGGLDSAHEYEEARELGFAVIPWDELAQLGTGVVAAAVERAAGKAYLTFDIDFVDQAFAPGAGAPEVGGPSSMQALALLRACRGLDLAGADVVEMLPEADHSRLTATLAATIAYEILTLVACARPPGPGEA